MKKAIKKALRSFGFELKRIQNNKDKIVPTINQTQIVSSHDTMFEGLKRNKCRGLNPATIVDVGAAEGKWTIDALKIWPDASYILFEPLIERKEILENLSKDNRKIIVINKGAGKENTEIKFQVTEDLDGSGFTELAQEAITRKVAITSIDEEIRKHQLKPPFLLKLDTHGFEVPILEGSKESLKHTELLVMECYGFKLNSIALQFPEMCAHMHTLGFRLVDIVDIMRRDKDQAFWQCDVFFIPKDSDIFNSNTYR